MSGWIWPRSDFIEKARIRPRKTSGYVTLALTVSVLIRVGMKKPNPKKLGGFGFSVFLFFGDVFQL